MRKNKTDKIILVPYGIYNNDVFNVFISFPAIADYARFDSIFREAGILLDGDLFESLENVGNESENLIGVNMAKRCSSEPN